MVMVWLFIARRWSLGDISSEDVVDEELEEQQHAEDETVATAQSLAILRRLVLRYLTTQRAQVSTDKNMRKCVIIILQFFSILY